MTAFPTTAAEAFAVLMTLKMRPFTNSDWDAYAGCESSNPYICETEDYTVVIDGNTLSFDRYNEDFTVDFVQFKLGEAVAG